MASVPREGNVIYTKTADGGGDDDAGGSGENYCPRDGVLGKWLTVGEIETGGRPT